ncbi:MAG: hypothetical protein U0414_18575 [Polyangiaceae bacterium]
MFGVPRRVFWAHVSWLRARLGRARGARVARFGGYAVLGTFAGCAVALRSIDGPTAAIEGYVVLAARASAWLCGGLVALSAANQRAWTDRRDGVEILAAMRGVRGRALEVARFASVALEIARSTLVAPWGVGLLAVALAGSASSALSRALVLLSVTLFALVEGAVVGAVAYALDRLRPAGARGLLVAVVVLPWALLDLIGAPGLSVPGFMSGVLGVALRVIGMGRLA